MNAWMVVVGRFLEAQKAKDANVATRCKMKKAWCSKLLPLFLSILIVKELAVPALLLLAFSRGSIRCVLTVVIAFSIFKYFAQEAWVINQGHETFRKHEPNEKRERRTTMKRTSNSQPGLMNLYILFYLRLSDL